MIKTMGIDVGSSSIKIAIMDYPTQAEAKQPEISHLNFQRIRRRPPEKVIQECFEQALTETGLKKEGLDYIASTGEGDLVTFRRGHFYGMTTHARGANFLFPETRSVIDMGALHARAIRIDERSRVMQYKMTGQCAAGSGQFVENISRYLGVSMEEVGPLSLQSKQPQMVSNICAVLAETDVINMVSRGIATCDILRGIHESISTRLTKLLKAINAESPLTLTGGMAHDAGLVEALKARLVQDGLDMTLNVHPYSMYAGALGAALWAGFRYLKLAA